MYTAMRVLTCHIPRGGAPGLGGTMSAAIVPPPIEAPAAATASTAAPEFARGDLAWGHCRGFPWWPCQVRSVRGKKKAEVEERKLRVRFLHTRDNAELTADKVLVYAPNVAQFAVVKKKTFKSAGLRTKFEAAIREAAAWHAAGSGAKLLQRWQQRV